MADDDRIRANFEAFGDAYCRADVFERYPETKVIPAYLRAHCADARIVLDLGFGPGLWFWASFLPALERVDGIDMFPAALAEADAVFNASETPEGYRLAHARVGSTFTLADLARLNTRRGRFVFQDHRAPWPPELARAQYDLVAEHGGGLGQMNSEEEVIGVVRQAAAALKPGGKFLFVNFQMDPSAPESQTSEVVASPLRLHAALFQRAMSAAGLRMVDFHAVERPADMPHVETFFYGYAQR